MINWTGCLETLNYYRNIDLKSLYICTPRQAQIIKKKWESMKNPFGFLFHLEFFFRTTQALEYFFFFRNLTLVYMTPKIRIFFSATLGIRIFF